MSDAIIVLNAGSSSLKFSVYSVSESQPALVVRGQIEGLGTRPAFKAKDQRGQVLAEVRIEAPNGPFGHAEAFAFLAQWLRQQYAGKLIPLAVGHRLAHGGEQFVEPTLLDEKVMSQLEVLVPLVPLHQPHNLAAIRGVAKLRADLPQVACFDTAFHGGRAPVTQRFGLPDAYHQRGVRRWGFHGLSYQSIAAQFRDLAPGLAKGRVIVAHLGSGASLCAMLNGHSVDTTMSFSALDGLPMGTRCGSLDPGVVLFLMREGLNVQQIEDLLYKKSGLLGISGISNDVRDLLASDNLRASEAIEFFVYRIIREISSLAGALRGMEALVFTAGIGENSHDIRRRVCEGLAWLGVRLDAAANERSRGCVSLAGSSPAVWVVPTDEEGVIASGTLTVLNRIKKHPNS